MKTLTIRNLIIGEGVPKIIIPIVGATVSEILEEAEEVKALNPDVIEWRADLFEEVFDLQAVNKTIVRLREFFSETLILFTFRSHKEGGNKEISDDFYVELNKCAILSKGIDLIDIEFLNEEKVLKSIFDEAKKNGVFVVMSNHDFIKTPPKDEIISRLRKMQELGADIPKVAVMPTCVDDVITLIDATNTMKSKYADRPIITMSMGGKGVISRLAGELFGSALTFGAGKKASAPGQIPVNELKDVLEIIHKRM